MFQLILGRWYIYHVQWAKKYHILKNILYYISEILKLQSRTHPWCEVGIFEEVGNNSRSPIVQNKKMWLVQESRAIVIGYEDIWVCLRPVFVFSGEWYHNMAALSNPVNQELRVFSFEFRLQKEHIEN